MVVDVCWQNLATAVLSGTVNLVLLKCSRMVVL